MRDRDKARRRAVGNAVEPLLQPPEHEAQPRRRGLQQERQEDRELPEAHAMLAQQPRASWSSALMSSAISARGTMP
jgi:hypothetical protein